MPHPEQVLPGYGLLGKQDVQAGQDEQDEQDEQNDPISFGGRRLGIAPCGRLHPAIGQLQPANAMSGLRPVFIFVAFFRKA